MGDTSIEWAHKVWNPVSGCSKVSQGCKHCYAERIFHRPYPGRDFTDVRTHPERLSVPMSWTKPQRVFVNSMSDLFHESVPDEFIDQVFAVMGACQWLTFIVLTKRPRRMLEWFAERWQPAPEWSQRERYEAQSAAAAKFNLTPGPFVLDTKGEDRYDQVHSAFDHLLVPDADRFWTEAGSSRFIEAGWPLPNVWLGVSVEDQASADERIPLLRQTPAAVRVLSCEPMLGPIDLWSIPNPGGPFDCDIRYLDWVIAGGESGPHARPVHPDWVRAIRDECVGAGVPFFFKQWGEHVVARLDVADGELTPWRIYPDGRRFWGLLESMRPRDEWPAELMVRVGKKASGRLLDGRTWDEVPA